MKYIAESSTYLSPIVTPSELRADYPDLSDEVPYHNLTVKVCESPELSERALQSVEDNAPDYITTLVVDDSVTAKSQNANQEIARRFGSQYFRVKGELSIVGAFSEFLTKENEGRLAAYLGRIATNYGSPVVQGAWGGARGTQNAVHLVNVMAFGEQGVSADQWLSTFIDQDVIVSTSAKDDAFPLTSMYSNLGVGVIASLYTHHLGSPTGLSARALQYLANHAQDMGRSEANQEVRNIMARAPTVGLVKPEDTLARYTDVAARNLDFPGGNYTLSGSAGFEKVPISIMGHDDQGYTAMLQLFVGAKELGVARVPGFDHVRKPDAPNAPHGSLVGYLTEIGPKMKAEQNAFIGALLEHAREIHVPDQRIEGLRQLQDGRHKNQLRSLEAIISVCGQLAGESMFADTKPELLAIQQGAQALIQSRFHMGSAADSAFAKTFITNALALQPRLVEKAYAFGERGGLEEYRRRLAH